MDEINTLYEFAIDESLLGLHSIEKAQVVVLKELYDITTDNIKKHAVKLLLKEKLHTRITRIKQII